MTDEQKTPVAIRITRPYATEQEYLEREFDTLTRTSVILLGAQSRPQGVVLRFEIVLKSGESMLRGEGRVVGFRDKAYAGEPGLSLRFTRLDARSKALVDRAAALRDARVRASASVMGMPAVVVPKAVNATPPPSSSSVDAEHKAPTSSVPPAPSSRRGPPPLPEWARSQVPPPPVPSGEDAEFESTQVNASFHHEALPSVRFDESPVPPPPPPPSVRAGARVAPGPPPLPRSPTPSRVPPPLPRPSSLGHGAAPSGRAFAPPSNREPFLSRLRARAQSLPASRVTEILTKRA